jgi:hypothetical protein
VRLYRSKDRFPKELRDPRVLTRTKRLTGRDLTYWARYPFREAAIVCPVFLLATLLWVGWVLGAPTIQTFLAGGVSVFCLAFALSSLIHWINGMHQRRRREAYKRQREIQWQATKQHAEAFAKTRAHVADMHAVSTTTREAIRQKRKAEVKAAREYYKRITGRQAPSDTDNTAPPDTTSAVF